MLDFMFALPEWAVLMVCILLVGFVSAASLAARYDLNITRKIMAFSELELARANLPSSAVKKV